MTTPKKPAPDDNPMNVMERMNERARQQSLQFSAPAPGESGSEVSADPAKQTEGQKARKQQKNIKSDVLVSILGEVTEFPNTPSNSAIMPSEMVRSALFNARNRQVKRSFLRSEKLVSIGEHNLKFTGEELRQDDCDLYLKIIELASEQNDQIAIETDIRIPVRFTPYAMAKAMGKACTTDFKKHLLESLNRMRSGLLGIESDRLQKNANRNFRSIAFNLLSDLTIEEHPGKPNGSMIMTELPIELVILMKGNYYTRIHWIQRLGLKSNVAKWMIGYFASHRKPHPITLEKVVKGCGIQTTRKPNQRQTVRNALKELVRVGFLDDYTLEDDILIVSRNPKLDAP